LEAAPTADGGFILAGIVGDPSFSLDFFVMKTDAAGNMQWSRTYNVLQKDGGSLDLVPTPDGGFLLAGSTCCDGGKAVAEVLKINGSGDVLWNKTYRSSSLHIELISKLRCPVVVYSVSGQPAWEGKADGVSGVDG
jgi:hypothetical protein